MLRDPELRRPGHKSAREREREREREHWRRVLQSKRGALRHIIEGSGRLKTKDSYLFACT